jgi:hypothetical protein
MVPLVGSNIHVAEQLPCRLNHSLTRQSAERALVPHGGSLINYLLFTAEQLGEETGLNWIIGVALATIFLSYAL